ncbi:hypothetical protein H696_01905 [Fonticula alba]|uniref:AP-4 complex subunit epsilon-1 C-terminal domain-containing protein n=1 Tax=Fonticula alba TaxID=691883 RepID=A0A058ZAL3_FONAL|nr:hypothetical protein H696_01905 [Fonticula alba]KCV70958.1 hypothetical protein H696_01905 [Fonticula alba]|eukprot:XP_009494081.1 hypothetical protein H696_01905 [Fonticula alba]
MDVAKELAQAVGAGAGVSSNYSREFTELIRAVSDAQSKEEEESLLKTEFKRLSSKMSEPNVSDKAMREYLLRVVFLEMLGLPATFGHIHAVNLAQKAQTVSEKRVAYLAVRLLLHRGHELCIMLIQTILRDLQSGNALEISYALSTASALVTRELLPALYAPVVGHLTHGKELVRKKALQCLRSFLAEEPDLVQQYPQLVEQQLPAALQDRDFGVVAAALSLYDELLTRGAARAVPAAALVPGLARAGAPGDGPAGVAAAAAAVREAFPLPSPAEMAEWRTRLVPPLVELQGRFLKQRITGSRGYEYSGVFAPWYQVQVLKLLALLGADSRDASEKMFPILLQTLHVVGNGVDAAYAVLYEAIRCIALIYPHPKLFECAAEALGRFLNSSNHNLKHLGIASLAELARADPSFAHPHQVAVLECLESGDQTLAKRSLALLARVSNVNNVEVVVARMIRFLRTGSLSPGEEGRRELVAQIVDLSERFAPSHEWYIGTMVQLFEVAGDLVDARVAENIMLLIAETGGEEDEDEGDDASEPGAGLLRVHAVLSLARLLRRLVANEEGDSIGDDDPAACPMAAPLSVETIPRMLLFMICWVIGEYGYVLADPAAQAHLSPGDVAAFHGAALLDMAARLLSQPLLSPAGRAWAVTMCMKLLVHQAETGPISIPATVEHAVGRLLAHHAPGNRDLLQRLLELRALLVSAPAVKYASGTVDTGASGAGSLAGDLLGLDLAEARWGAVASSAGGGAGSDAEPPHPASVRALLLPRDASSEEFDIDPSLGFLDAFVQERASRPALSTVSMVRRRVAGTELGGGSGAATTAGGSGPRSGIRFEAYAAPVLPVPTMATGLGSAWPGASGTGSAGAPAGTPASLPGTAPAVHSLNLAALSGNMDLPTSLADAGPAGAVSAGAPVDLAGAKAKQRWGRTGYQGRGDAAPGPAAPAASNTPPDVTTSPASRHPSSLDFAGLTATAAAPTAGMAPGAEAADRARAPASASVPAPRGPSAEERAAAALFAGVSSRPGAVSQPATPSLLDALSSPASPAPASASADLLLLGLAGAGASAAAPRPLDDADPWAPVAGLPGAFCCRVPSAGDTAGGSPLRLAVALPAGMSPADIVFSTSSPIFGVRTQPLPAAGPNVLVAGAVLQTPLAALPPPHATVRITLRVPGVEAPISLGEAPLEELPGGVAGTLLPFLSNPGSAGTVATTADFGQLWVRLPHEASSPRQGLPAAGPGARPPAEEVAEGALLAGHLRLVERIGTELIMAGRVAATAAGAADMLAHLRFFPDQTFKVTVRVPAGLAADASLGGQVAEHLAHAVAALVTRGLAPGPGKKQPGLATAPGPGAPAASPDIGMLLDL